jgi:hypothetical protein
VAVVLLAASAGALYAGRMVTFFLVAPVLAAQLFTGAHTREVRARGLVVRAVAREDARGTSARLEIRRGAAAQTIDLAPRDVGADTLLASIAVVDVNFDGRPDVTVLRELGAKWGAVDAFVFDARTRRFSDESPVARAIGRLSNATFDPAHATITTHDIGPSNPSRVTYKIEHGVLREIASCRFLNPFDEHVGTLVRARGGHVTFTKLRLGAVDVDPCGP